MIKLAMAVEAHAGLPMAQFWGEGLTASNKGLSPESLDRRIPDRETMVSEVAAWQEHRNASAKPVNWRFRIEDARIKLRSLYPSIQ